MTPLAGLSVLVAVVVAISACTGGAGSQDGGPTVAPTDAPSLFRQPLQAEADATPTPDQRSTPPAARPRPAPVADGPRAPDVRGIAAWINSGPLSIPGLRGKVVLVDFWTYTCVNCIRTFPFLKEWQARYADQGLVILGVHTPEFEFEQDLENVRDATIRNGIVWPVALDNDFATWNAFSNRFWPAKYLIDKDGVIRYTHFGEGQYAETESKIRELLEEAGADLPLAEAELPEDQAIDQTFLENRTMGITPELYAGYRRGCNPLGYYYLGHPFVGNFEYCRSIDQVHQYQDPGGHLISTIYLQGPWYAGEESLRYAPDGEFAQLSDHLALRVAAKSVNAVIKPHAEGEPFKVLVTLDGQPLTPENRGEDIVIEEDGSSFLVIDEPKMYKVVEAPSFGIYELKMSPESPRFAIFAFTFGVYKSGA